MMEDNKMIKHKLIAIDTEYHCNKIGLIDNVYCISASDMHGHTFSKWLSHTKDPDILETILNQFKVPSDDDSDVKYIFICHALEKAERRALLHLNVDVEKYNFICTWHLAKMLQNTFSSEKGDKDSLSYASLCTKYNLSLIDTDHKEQMRKLCIDDNTEGHEDEIMQYCTEDTVFLIPLFNKLFVQYHNRLNNSFCPIKDNRPIALETFQNITANVSIECLINLNRNILEFGKVADKGIRLNPERVSKIKQNAPAFRSELKKRFNEQYPGCYRIENSKQGPVYVRDTKKVQEYLKQSIIELKLNNYPKTKTGYSTDSDTLKEYFKDTDTFGEHYRQHTKQITLLNKVSKVDGNPLDSIIDDDKMWYESLEPMGTITGRCTPKGKFIFGWHKSFYGLMEPPKGKWYCELDYSAEETFIQACICKDKIYHNLYASKDIYLGFVRMLGQLPESDWNNLSTDELKEKYKPIRRQYKTVLLGLSYGMGTQKLAEKGKMSYARAEKVVNDVKRILSASTRYKEMLNCIPGRVKAFSNPDGFICAYDENAKFTSTTNWPFQSGGGYILRVLLHRLLTECKSANVLASVHDAVFFEVDEGDYDTINKVRQIMQDVVSDVLNEKEHTIKVGKPDIIKHGDIWCADEDESNPKNKKQFIELLNYEIKDEK